MEISNGLMSINPISLSGMRSLFQEKYLRPTEPLEVNPEATLEEGTTYQRRNKGFETEVIGKTLIYKISGILMPDSVWQGTIDTLELMESLQEIEGIYDKVIFYIKSPGGSVNGMFEVAEIIKSITVKTIAFSDTILCSAAYLMAASCDEIVVTPSTMIGSIGVIWDIIKYPNEYSYTFTKGIYKAAFHQNKKMDLSTKIYIEQILSLTYERLVETISKYRNKPLQEVKDTEGASVLAYMNSWFYDRTVLSYGHLINQ